MEAGSLDSMERALLFSAEPNDASAFNTPAGGCQQRDGVNQGQILFVGPLSQPTKTMRHLVSVDAASGGQNRCITPA